MTKAEIVREIASSTGIDKASVLETVEKFMDTVEMLTAAIASAFAEEHAYTREHIEETWESGNPHNINAIIADGLRMRNGGFNTLEFYRQNHPYPPDEQV